MSRDWIEKGTLSLEKLRIDSTVVASNIAPPSDSQLLNDSVRVLSRALAISQNATGLKIRFTDKRKTSKSLAFRIFNAKNAEKKVLYPILLKVVEVVLKQVERALIQVRKEGGSSVSMQKWISKVTHYKDLTLRIVNQTVCRVIDKEGVPSSEKIVSLFEEHTDIIVKGFRDVHYGHKINLSTEKNGLITYLCIEKGNPADSDRFMPILNAHQNDLGYLPKSVVSDGCYASQNNVSQGRALGIQPVVFNKRVGLSFHAMGVKRKTFDRLRCFRAGVEGNIPELKRAFGMSKAQWKGHNGFKAFVWASVISDNLVCIARMQSG
ncbi:elements of external origin; transposon-related functions [hydrothermal vent metagenome]|uniref:Elements of external origin transposon-related functions n=1 Tax=hydrothermal vent metagenome TaxID=652676 RepID=A0A3B0Z296_9ZZZZ